MNQKAVKDLFLAFQDVRSIQALLPPLPRNLRPRHIHVIETIHHLEETRGTVRVSDISSALGVTRPGMTRLVHELSENGAVTLSRDAKDRRVFHVSLTEKGNEWYRYYVADFHAWLASHLPRISTEDAETAVRVIHEVQSVLRQQSLQIRQGKKEDHHAL